MEPAMTPEDQKRWVEQWREAGKALLEVKRQELRALTEVQAARDALMLARVMDELPGLRRTRETSGLVEQQRLFRKWNR
jgi:hypothetical protein